ncbi:MAG TPA: ABC transporter substrate-binding protein, partial [Rhizomicrobium sp.]|nr:ABC transporter substrate-binding protein [Rhizomicrobium sp.]
RSVSEILDMIRTLGALVGAGDRANDLASTLAANLEQMRKNAPRHRPKVYFEEWDDPMISGIQWVSELIAIAGGDDIFPERAKQKSAKNRIVTAQDIIDRAPDIVIGSWCGKKFRPEKFAARAGFDALPAVRNGRVHEIKSALILQPGPAALTDGLAALQAIIGAA